jgi:transcriptional regulator with XRE-family HTH domain
MPLSLGDVLKQARQRRGWTLRQLADQVTKEDGTAISPQYLFDIETHHRIPTPHVLAELARVLALEYDTLLALAGAADVVLREYLGKYPQHTAALIQLLRTAQRCRFEEWKWLRQQLETHGKAGA